MPEELQQEVAQQETPAIDTPADSRTNDELDLLADGVEKPRNSERAMKAAPKETPADKKAAAEKFEFEFGGKKIQGTREQILKWAQLGYDRPQFMQKFNAERAKFEAERKAHQEEAQKNSQTWNIYRQIDDFAAKNPGWWQHVHGQWQNRQNFQPGAAETGAPAQVDPKFAAIEQKLGQFDQFFSEWKQEKQQAQEQFEDQTLDKEIQSIQQQHKDLDWVSIDENGKSLEMRVLEHAQEIGTKSFRAALRDLLHEDLITRAQSQAKLAVAKGIQQKTKLGVLGETPTSTKWNPKKETNIGKKSYEDLEREIREDLRAGRVG